MSPELGPVPKKAKTRGDKYCVPGTERQEEISIVSPELRTPQEYEPKAGGAGRFLLVVEDDQKAGS